MPTFTFTDAADVFSKASVGRNSNLPGSITDIVSPLQNLVYSLVISPLNKAQITSVSVTQTIAFQIVKSITSLVTVTPSIGFNIDRRVPELLSYAPITQSIVAWIDHGVSGNSGNVFVDPVIIAIQAALTPATTVSFDGFTPMGSTNPSVGSITLRKPDFGDTDDYEQYRIQRNTLGGGLEIFRDEMWEDTSTFNMTFSWLSQAEAIALQTFIYTNLGKRVHFSDQFGQTWDGYLSTPDTSIGQPKVVGFTVQAKFQIWTK